MTESKYHRNVTLICPTCGGTQFAFDDEDESALVTCQTCNRIIARSDLIAANGENIGAHIEQIKSEAVADFKKHIRDALKGK